MKNILLNFDVATVREAIRGEIPDLAINSITIIETGWDHLVAEVNEEWIFRFPRNTSSIANLEREKNLLEYLKNHITLPIPRFIFVGKKHAFVGYKKLPGIHLNQQIYNNLKPEVCLLIAQTLATFFSELHRAVSIEQALLWGYSPIIRPLSRIEIFGNSLPADIGIMINEALIKAKEDLSQRLVFIHQDVNGDNTAFDMISGQITGVFDFSDTAMGPRSWDFAELFGIDERLAKLTAEIYADMNRVPNPLVGGAADYILRKATQILEGQQTSLNAKLLQDLKDFLPIWHGLKSS
jgi:aminoglycoside 2''-phosphotransferase